MSTECETMDPSAGLTRPCFTAPLATANHWCVPCLAQAKHRLETWEQLRDALAQAEEA